MSRKLYLHNCIYTLDKYLSTNKDRDYHLRNSTGERREWFKKLIIESKLK